MNEHVINEGLENNASVPELAGSAALAPAAPVHQFRQLRRMLRGRYFWVVLLGMIWACTGGAAGYKYVKPLYRSTGLIEIKPYVPRIIFETEDTQLMPMFDQFVASQVELMQSPRVVDQAMADETWRRFGRDMSQETKQEFRDSLLVTRQRRSNLVGVSFTDEDPKAANAAVRAMIGAYMDIFGERDARGHQERLKVLDGRRTALMDGIRDMAKEYGSDSLEDMYRFELQEVQQLKHALRTTQLEAVSAGVALDPNAERGLSKDVNVEGTSDDARRQRWKSMSVRQIAQIDKHMYGLLEEKRRLDNEIEMNRVRFADKHPQIQRLLKLRSATRKAIESHAEEFRQNVPPLRAGTKAGPVDAKKERLRLEHQRRQLGTLHEKARQETLKLGRKLLTISGLKEERASIRERLAETKQRIEHLNVESAISGRINKISEGEASPLPINRGKRKQMAVLGFVGGGCAGIGLVLLIGYRDRRLRDSEDAELGIGKVRMLGLLPHLPEDLSDSDNVVNACYAVHHIRTLLQLNPNGAGQRVFTVTGPVPGTGKTSLTLALGLSFASSGCKTLLIDADIGGGGLTHRLRTIIRRRLGQILQRGGLVSDQQLRQALQLARSESKPLGQTLVEMGVLNEDDLAEALSNQKTMPIGLLDAMDDEPLESCTAETEIANLSILPVGGAEARDISRLSPVGIRRVIGEARRRFDTILIDAGPVPAATVGGIAASAADQTVLVVSRGDQRTSAERAIAFLESIGARMAGVVFNRAAAGDIARSKHSSAADWSHRSVRSRNESDRVSSGAPRQETALACTDRFDPVTRAVATASALRGTEDDSNG